MEKREPNDKDWERLFKGIPLSEQGKLYISYLHCSCCGKKIDYCEYTITDDNVYCDTCLMITEGTTLGLMSTKKINKNCRRPINPSPCPKPIKEYCKTPNPLPGVHYFDELSAKRNGVILVTLKPSLCGKVVTAIDYSSGKCIRIGMEIWVRSEIEKMGINIIKEV